MGETWQDLTKVLSASLYDVTCPHNSSVPIFSSAIFFFATLDIKMSMGLFVSYSDGACRIIRHVPNTHASVKIHRKSRSSTIATYFQSSSTLTEDKAKKIGTISMEINNQNFNHRFFLRFLCFHFRQAGKNCFKHSNSYPIRQRFPNFFPS